MSVDEQGTENTSTGHESSSPTSENGGGKVGYLHGRAGRGQRSIILLIKTDTITKLENAVNVESSMDGTVAHLFKRKRARGKQGGKNKRKKGGKKKKKRKKKKKKERKDKQTASICT
jgi:hypothetical protein